MNTKQLLLTISTFGVIFSSCMDNSPAKTANTSGTTAPSTYLNPNITYGSVTDIDGNKYATVTIGTQTWMAENLRVTHYRNGDAIPNVTDSTAWHNLTTGAQCTYNNTTFSDTITKYGRLYNFYAVSDSRNIAPVGWHVATKDEWDMLLHYAFSLYSKKNYPGQLKSLASVKGWTFAPSSFIADNPSINNSTGFSAIPAGGRIGKFQSIGFWCFWWTSTAYDTNNGWEIHFGVYSTAYPSYLIKPLGMSVRCVKD